MAERPCHAQEDINTGMFDDNVLHHPSDPPRRPGHNWHLPPLLPSRNWSHFRRFLASARIKVLNCCSLVTPICTILLLCSDLINGELRRLVETHMTARGYCSYDDSNDPVLPSLSPYSGRHFLKPRGSGRSRKSRRGGDSEQPMG